MDSSDAVDINRIRADNDLTEEAREVASIDAKLELMQNIPFAEKVDTAIRLHPEHLEHALIDPRGTAKAVSEEVVNQTGILAQVVKTSAEDTAIEAQRALRTAGTYYGDKSAEVAYAYKEHFDKSMFSHAVRWWSGNDN